MTFSDGLWQDNYFEQRERDDTQQRHISGPCQAAYARGCRCNDCRRAWREARRNKTAAKPSPLALEVERLNAELDAAEMNLDALREENAMLRCRLDEVQP